MYKYSLKKDIKEFYSAGLVKKLQKLTAENTKLLRQAQDGAKNAKRKGQLYSFPFGGRLGRG